MNQNVIFDWFKVKRMICDDFYSVKEVEAEAEKVGVYKGSIRGMIIKLYAFGYLEVNNEGLWCRKFRLKSSLVCADFKSPLSKDISSNDLKKLQH